MTNAGNAPATRGFAITKSDSTIFTHATRGIWVGGAGDLVVVTQGNDTLTLVGVLAGSLIPVAALQVKAATTATDLVGLY